MNSHPPPSCVSITRAFRQKCNNVRRLTAAGVEELTSRRSQTTHASTKDAFAADGARTPPNGVRTRGEMEEKRINASLVKKNAEAEAATKIQASFRGYQVRKQLKLKVSVLFDVGLFALLKLAPIFWFFENSKLR